MEKWTELSGPIDSIGYQPSSQTPHLGELLSVYFNYIGFTFCHLQWNNPDKYNNSFYLSLMATSQQSYKANLKDNLLLGFIILINVLFTLPVPFLKSLHIKAYAKISTITVGSGEITQGMWL